MRKYLFLLALSAFSVMNLNATAIVIPPAQKILSEINAKFSLPNDMVPTIEQFLKLTPKQIQKITGKKLSFKEVIELKLAQKKLKHEMSKPSGGEKFSKGVWILLAILGWCWLLMGISDDWSGSKWIVNLVLYVLCWLPGLIHSLVHMKEYTE